MHHTIAHEALASAARTGMLSGWYVSGNGFLFRPRWAGLSLTGRLNGKAPLHPTRQHLSVFDMMGRRSAFGCSLLRYWAPTGDRELWNWWVGATFSLVETCSERSLVAKRAHLHLLPEVQEI